MSDRLATIYLHGPLADRFGDEHHFAVRTPIEAMRALHANHPGFIGEFAKHERYMLLADGDWRNDKQVEFPFSKELHIVPVIEGRAFVGAALVTAVFPAIGATAATIIGGLLMAGIFIGLSYLLTPKIKREDSEGKDENYAFTGPENVTGQGVAVPLIYGRVHAGSVVVSAGLDLGTDLAATVEQPAPTPPASGSTAVEPGMTPPPGGWPPIVSDRFGNKQPQGWVLVGTTKSLVEIKTAGANLGQRLAKSVYIYAYPVLPGTTSPYAKYRWNYNRGFYTIKTTDWPKEADYQPGGHR